LTSVIKYFVMFFIRLYRFIYKNITEIFGKIYLFANNVEYHRPIFIFGIPIISISKGGMLSIGKNFVMVNSAISNLIGRSQKCSFYVGENAMLKIGDNVGMSATSIVCTKKVSIGNNVRLGGNTVIYDTDFHSLVREERVNEKLDKANVKNAPVIIEDGVFVGAHTTILKGVTIGEDSIVGACSVVTKNIPKNEIWGGNPAKFIRKIN